MYTRPSGQNLQEKVSWIVDDLASLILLSGETVIQCGLQKSCDTLNLVPTGRADKFRL